MLKITDLEGYWEFYELPVSEERLNTILEIFNTFEENTEIILNEKKIERAETTHYSPHAVIRVMQSTITTQALALALDSVSKTHLYGLIGKIPYNSFVGPLKVYRAALDRVENKNKNIFIVFKTREEAHIKNRLDIISIGVPGVRPRNSKKPKNWELMTNNEKKEFFQNRKDLN